MTEDDEVVYKIDIPANRYDLLCLEGLSTALLIFMKKFVHNCLHSFSVLQFTNCMILFYRNRLPAPIYKPIINAESCVTVHNRHEVSWFSLRKVLKIRMFEEHDTSIFCEK